MKPPLQTRVEKFIGLASYMIFNLEQKPYLFRFIFTSDKFPIFNDKTNHEDLRDFFRGRKLKLVIYTPDTIETIVSLVDTETADTLKIEGPKFIDTDIYHFGQAKVPAETIFLTGVLCEAVKKEQGLGIHPYWVGKKPLEIHGYSLIDNRSPE